MKQERLLGDSSIIFPPWPAAPSEERAAVTVTLGSFWTRKMVHQPPHVSLPPHTPPPLTHSHTHTFSSQQASSDAAVTIPLPAVSNACPGGPIANQSRGSIQGPLCVQGCLVKPFQVGFPHPHQLLDNLGKEGKQVGGGTKGEGPLYEHPLPGNVRG